MLWILLLAAALVWHDLGAREVLGRDENVTIVKVAQPSLQTMLDSTRVTFSGQPSNVEPLYFVLQYLFWPLVERSSFMLRFLPSFFGLLAVTFTYKLGQVLFDERVGLAGALLTTLLPLHVRYAQIARPYTLLAMLSLASACLLVLALNDGRAVHWLGFVVAATLNLYNHYAALFVVAAEGLYAGFVWLRLLGDVRGRRAPPRRLWEPVIGFLSVGVLCTPALLHLLDLHWIGSGIGEEATAGQTVAFTIPFFRHYLYMTGLKTIGVQNLIFGLILLGLAVTLYRRGWQAALLAGLWITVPFAVWALLTAPRRFEERYVIFVTPVIFLLIGQVAVTAGDWIGRVARRTGRATSALLVLGLASLLVSPLQVYYATNRQEERLNWTLSVVETYLDYDDVIIVSPRFFTRPLDAGAATVLYLTEQISTEELDRLAATHHCMWLLYASYLPAAETQEPLGQWVQAHADAFVHVPIKTVNVLAFGTLAPQDREICLLERIEVLEDLAQVSAGQAEARQRYGILAEACQVLAEYYQSRGQVDLAGVYRRQAEEARSVVRP
jgi:hypothetical protein